jgi:hypothetical protein
MYLKVFPPQNLTCPQICFCRAAQSVWRAELAFSCLLGPIEAERVAVCLLGFALLFGPSKSAATETGLARRIERQDGSRDTLCSKPWKKSQSQSFVAIRMSSREKI